MVRQVHGGTWKVRSQQKTRILYSVNLEKRTCTCPDWGAWGMDCKHIFGVIFFTEVVIVDPVEEKMDDTTNLPSKTYPQKWAAYNKAQIGEQEWFESLLQQACATVPQPPQGRGRRRLPLSDVIYLATRKVYSTKSGRRASDALSACHEKDLVGSKVHHNTINRYLRKEELTPILTSLIELTATPLQALETDFAIDSSGFATTTYDRWYDHKWGQPSRRARWLKCHVIVGAKTNVVTSVKITSLRGADTTMLPELLAASAKEFKMERLSGDKAYLSRVNLAAIEEAGAMPLVPFKYNSVNVPSHPAWQRMWTMFWTEQDRFNDLYHKRSNVETTFHMIKAKLGGSVRSKNFTAQTNELLCKVLAHNIIVLIHEACELGLDPKDFMENLGGASKGLN